MTPRDGDDHDDHSTQARRRAKCHTKLETGIIILPDTGKQDAVPGIPTRAAVAVADLVAAGDGLQHSSAPPQRYCCSP